MTTPAALRRRVLTRIRPTAAHTQRARKAALELSRRIQQMAADEGHKVLPTLVGSLQKRTHLKHPDVDLFLLFPPTVTRAALQRDGLRLARRFLTHRESRYAEHPYVRGRFRGLDFDVVPAYQIEDPQGRKSAVDRTPFHTRLVLSKLPAARRDDVRLLKQFLIGIEAYGAETSIGGFSGYLAELLVLRYQSFDGVLEAATRWPARPVLGLDDDVPTLGGALSFADPVDRHRNAAAAVSKDRLQRLRRAAKSYRLSPDIRHFFPRAEPVPSSTTLVPKLRDTAVVGFHLPRPRIRREAQGPHAVRFGRKVHKMMLGAGFDADRPVVVAVRDGHLLAIAVRPTRLPATSKHRGPRQADAEHVARFRARWKSQGLKPFVDDGRWWVDAPRRHRTPAALLKNQRLALLDGTRWSPEQRRRAAVLLDRQWLASTRRRVAAGRLLDPHDPWTR